MQIRQVKAAIILFSPSGANEVNCMILHAVDFFFYNFPDKAFLCYAITKTLWQDVTAPFFISHK